jgi:DNA mismatch endonuclease (patch repair protein)
MADIVSAQTRSRMMAGIGSVNTAPELIVRSALHRQGLRFRLHCDYLPGRPDIVLPKWKCVVLVHGCFWHGHHCRLFRLPGSNREFWQSKIQINRKRDAKVKRELRSLGWRVEVVHECQLRGRPQWRVSAALKRLAQRIRNAGG